MSHACSLHVCVSSHSQKDWMHIQVAVCANGCLSVLARIDEIVYVASRPMVTGIGSIMNQLLGLWGLCWSSCCTKRKCSANQCVPIFHIQSVGEPRLTTSIQMFKVFCIWWFSSELPKRVFLNVFDLPNSNKYTGHVLLLVSSLFSRLHLSSSHCVRVNITDPPTGGGGGCDGPKAGGGRGGCIQAGTSHWKWAVRKVVLELDRRGPAHSWLLFWCSSLKAEGKRSASRHIYTFRCSETFLLLELCQLEWRLYAEGLCFDTFPHTLITNTDVRFNFSTFNSWYFFSVPLCWILLLKAGLWSENSHRSSANTAQSQPAGERTESIQTVELLCATSAIRGGGLRGRRDSDPF